jgi:hypothetical protein
VHSTVRDVLHREQYRGVMVWNQTRKRDRWGKQDQRPRPQAEWLRVPTPALQIVSTDLWTRAMHNSRRGDTSTRRSASRSTASEGGWRRGEVFARYTLTTLITARALTVMVNSWFQQTKKLNDPKWNSIPHDYDQTDLNRLRIKHERLCDIH